MIKRCSNDLFTIFYFLLVQMIFMPLTTTILERVSFFSCNVFNFSNVDLDLKQHIMKKNQKKIIR